MSGNGYDRITQQVNLTLGRTTYLIFPIVAAIAFLPASANAVDFAKNKQFFASSVNQNFLPNGTLVKTAKSNAVYYIKDGKKSLVLPRIIEIWFKEAHYFKIDSVVTISPEDLSRYADTTAVNPLYIGKILQGPDKTQYFIDDKLQKRTISSAVRAALKYPGRNLYPTTSSHLAQFKTGPEIKRTDVHPGGTVMYNGAYHGGTVWRVEEKDGKYIKHYYLQDYIYETEGYPWSGQIMPVSTEELARYQRGANIERYPDGWQVGIGNDKFIVQSGTLRKIASEKLYKAMGYNPKYVLTVFPEFLKRYPRGNNIAGFKTIFEQTAVKSSGTSAAPSAANNLTKVRPAIRTLIGEVNDIYLTIFDKQISVSDNKFWVDYIYNGEISTKNELTSAMKKERSTGKKPARTPRDKEIGDELLKSKWFPYLFYFVWQREPDGGDKQYWYDRIEKDRNTINKLGETIQWLKDTSGKSHK